MFGSVGVFLWTHWESVHSQQRQGKGFVWHQTCQKIRFGNSDKSLRSAKNHLKNIKKPHTCLWNCLLSMRFQVTLITLTLPRSAKSKAKKWPPLAQRSRKSLAWKWGENDNAPGSCHGKAATWPFKSQISWLRWALLAIASSRKFTIELHTLKILFGPSCTPSFKHDSHLKYSYPPSNSGAILLSVPWQFSTACGPCTNSEQTKERRPPLLLHCLPHHFLVLFQNLTCELQGKAIWRHCSLVRSSLG